MWRSWLFRHGSNTIKAFLLRHRRSRYDSRVFWPKFQSVLRSLPSGMWVFNFDKAQNERRDVAIMTLPIRSYYDQVISTALLVFPLRFLVFCLKFQSIPRSPPSGMFFFCLIVQHSVESRGGTVLGQPFPTPTPPAKSMSKDQFTPWFCQILHNYGSHTKSSIQTKSTKSI